jgi:hypothetical protein
MATHCVPGRTFSQFDGHALAARNCGVSVARSLVHFGSRGRIAPSAEAIRDRIGHDPWPGPGRRPSWSP